MGIFDFIKNEFIDVIEWTDDSRDTLVWRFPDQDQAIKNGAQLIVRESQIAQFVYLGEFADTFGTGKHTLTTENIPLLTKLKSWKYAFNSPFKADVYYVTTRLFNDQKWGTPNPIPMRDPDFGIVRITAFGNYDFRITDPVKFLKEISGTSGLYTLDEFGDTMRARMVSVFTEAVVKAKVPFLDLAMHYSDLSATLLPAVSPITKDKYGIELTSFVIENIGVPEAVQKAIDERASMGAIGNMNQYVQYQMAQGMNQPGGGGGNPATAAAQMAMGMAMAQQMMQGLQQPPPAAPVPVQAQAPSAAPVPDLMGVAEVAQMLGVSEDDVLAILTSGELKGKKIGSTYRITRAAVEEYLNS